MPSIPPTRQRILKRPQQDHIQWTLTNHHEKKNRQCIKLTCQDKPITTVDIALSFMKLLNNQNNVRSENGMIESIKKTQL
jgi:hypothetical protein